MSIVDFAQFHESSAFALHRFSSTKAMSSLHIDAALCPLFSGEILDFDAVSELVSFSETSLRPAFPKSLPPYPTSEAVRILRRTTYLRSIDTTSTHTDGGTLVGERTAVEVSGFFFVRPTL